MGFQKRPVARALPQRIAALREIAYNLWWSWQTDAVEVFSRIEPALWEDSGGNPVQLLAMVEPQRLEQLASDSSFVEELDELKSRLDRYLAEPPRLEARDLAPYGEHCVAYFSPEFGVNRCIPLYAGGLGILAGDHLKAASDLGLPMVGVGLLYRQGYFSQYLDRAGWQQEDYPRNDFSQLPVSPVTGAGGQPVMISVKYPAGPVHAQVWKIQVGKVPLYLLDTDVERNRPEDREITGQLYGGDQSMRLRQEVMLGIGGMRALRAMGIEPKVCHMNEGHSALQAIERVRILVEQQGASFAAACEAVAAGSVFTTHTPVPAGNDIFDAGLVEQYLAPLREALGVSETELLALGRIRPQDHDARFAMPVLALHLASQRNAVSRLHGQVARGMWKQLWPGLPESEVPIHHITNGVHLPTWLSPELSQLYDSYLAHDWREHLADQSVWEPVSRIPDEELWQVRQRLRERLVAFARRRLERRRQRPAAPPAATEAARDLLDPGTLTIGFARRFATYKRGALLFRDPHRLARILGHTARPVQIIFAGKAHPADHDGKEIMQSIVRHARGNTFCHSVVFLEDYDMDMASYLLHGVDVWVNNPRRPLEACGTSGMKAAMNGAINVSVLDGWWEEAYRPDIGWAIGAGEVHDDFEYQDRLEAESLYRILENEVVPRFYQRDPDGIPRSWIQLLKSSLQAVSPAFDTERMIGEYARRFYAPAASRWEDLTKDRLTRCQLLAEWKKRIARQWNEVRILAIEPRLLDRTGAAGPVTVRVRVALGSIKPEEVAVQLCSEEGQATSEASARTTERMRCEGAGGNGTSWFAVTLRRPPGERAGYRVRIVPHHPDLVVPEDLGLVISS